MKVFSKKISINCTLEELFDFHLDTNNITKITPKNVKISLLNSGSKALEGKIVKIKTTSYFISTLWEVKIETLKRPELLVDVAIKSPFKYWKHSHIFTQDSKNCILEDRIEYKMPFGFLGKLLEFFVHLQLDSMFSYRQQKTKFLLEKS